MPLHEVLVSIAQRLPLPALVRFAKVNDQTCAAAQEAWDTWRDGCAAMRVGRMITDKSWMDAYTRSVRQRSFRTVNAADMWDSVALPQWLIVALKDVFDMSHTRFELRVRKDCSTVHLLVLYNADTAPALVLSGTGRVWRFDEHARTCLTTEQKATIVSALSLLTAKKGVASSPFAQPLAPALPDKHRILAEAAARLHCTSVETRSPSA